MASEPAEPTTRQAPKSYFADDRVELYHGDMREILPALDVRADAVVTDPPYGETSLVWDRWPDGWVAALGDVTNALWCFGSMRMFGTRWADFNGWKFSQDVVWEKQSGSGPAVDRFNRVHEHAAFWYRGPWSAVYHVPTRVPKPVGSPTAHSTALPGASRGEHFGHGWAKTPYVDDGLRLPRSVLKVRSMNRRAIHPTEKPAAILAPLIEYSVPVGGLVLDPFAGSGSTLLTARSLGRRAVGIEADERYCEAAARRLSEADLFATMGASDGE